MLLEKIDQHAQSNAIFYIYERENVRIEYGYRELKTHSDRIATYILDQQGRDKRPVIVIGHKSPLMVTLFLACAKAGHPYCPIDTSMPKDRIQKILEETQARIVFTLDDAPEMEQGIDEVALQEIIETYRPFTGPYLMQAEDIYYIIFTSGSTGDPKGVQISYQNLESYVEWALSLVPQDGQAVFMNQAPFSFDLSVMDLYLSLASGAKLFVLDRDQQSSFKRLMKRFKNSQMTVWVSTPSFADYCLADPQFDHLLLPELKTFLFCGEVLANRTVKELMSRFPHSDVINTYGPTEATVCVTSLKVTETILNQNNPLPIGIPKPGTRLYIEKEDPSDKRGEILIIGDTVSPGYYKNPDLNSRCFKEVEIDGKKASCYRTGDLGYYENGYYFCSGRTDAQIKLHGFRMELGDIENNIMKLDGVRQAVVVPVYKEDKVERLTAYLVMDEKPKKPLQKTIALKRKLKAYLMDYMIPKRFIYVEGIPISTNGKVNRKALEDLEFPVKK